MKQNYSKTYKGEEGNGQDDTTTHDDAYYGGWFCW
jgi:hypothetical protein